MKHYIRILVLLTALTLAGIPSHSRVLRGVWVTAWSDGIFTPAQCDETLQKAQAIGSNALFIQVRKVADAYYDSDIEPAGDDLLAGFDPLAYIIPKAKMAGMEVHAWVNVYRVWREKTPPTNPDHIVNKHLDWINETDDGEVYAAEGVFLDPAIPEAREYIAKITADIANRYPVDGIHLDYIRYPGKDWGYSDRALAIYSEDTGARGRPAQSDAKWLDWKREQVTKTVRLIRAAVKKARPSARVTAATIAWGDCPNDFAQSRAYRETCQDWKGWAEEGILDANIPMNYRQETSASSAEQYRKWIAGFKKWGGDKPFYVGIAAYLNTPEHTAQQIKGALKRDADGYVLFSFNDSKCRDALVTYMKKSQ